MAKSEKHVVMKHSLAKALLDAGIEHFASGGLTQGGIGGALSSQTDYQATAPTITTQDFAPQISNLQNQNQNLYNQQQSLGQALLARSQGQGPNPAAAQLNQATGKNVANEAALMASSRGASANPGLIARQAAEVGAGTQQAAVGQEATLEAQQQLAAENELSGLYNNEATQSLQGQSINQSGQAAQNSAETTGQLGAQEVNAQIAGANTAQSNSTTGGLIGGIVSPLASLLNKGGKVQKLADGGIANYSSPVDPRVVLNIPGGDPNSGKGLGGAMGQGAKSLIGGSGAPSLEVGSTAIDAGTGAADLSGAGGAGLGAADAGAAAAGAEASDAGAFVLLASKGWNGQDFRTGGDVPGEAEVKGDSPKNDTVPALLSPGEEVLPRSVTTAPDAPERAKRFVEALQDKKGNQNGYAKVLKAKQTLKERVEHLEKLCAGGRA